MIKKPSVSRKKQNEGVLKMILLISLMSFIAGLIIGYSISSSKSKRDWKKRCERLRELREWQNNYQMKM